MTACNLRDAHAKTCEAFLHTKRVKIHHKRSHWDSIHVVPYSQCCYDCAVGLMSAHTLSNSQTTRDLACVVFLGYFEQ